MVCIVDHWCRVYLRPFSLGFPSIVQLAWWNTAVCVHLSTPSVFGPLHNDWMISDRFSWSWLGLKHLLDLCIDEIWRWSALAFLIFRDDQAHVLCQVPCRHRQAPAASWKIILPKHHCYQTHVRFPVAVREYHTEWGYLSCHGTHHLELGH